MNTDMKNIRVQPNFISSASRKGWIAAFCMMAFMASAAPVYAAETNCPPRSHNIYCHVVNSQGVQAMQAQDLFNDPQQATPLVDQPGDKNTPIAAPVDNSSPLADRLPVQHNANFTKAPLE